MKRIYRAASMTKFRMAVYASQERETNLPGDTPYKPQRAMKESGLTLQQVCDHLKSDYGVELLPSSLSRSISRGSIRLQRALQILAICGVSEVGIKAG